MRAFEKVEHQVGITRTQWGWMIPAFDEFACSLAALLTWKFTQKRPRPFDVATLDRRPGPVDCRLLAVAPM